MDGDPSISTNTESNSPPPSATTPTPSDTNGSATAPASSTASSLAKRHRAAPPKTFACRGYGECRMVFSRSEHLARHVRKHTGERPFQCHCGKQFSRLDNLRQHAQTVHADKQEQNERMMRELTTLHTSMSAGAKRDARKKASVSHNVSAVSAQGLPHGALHHPSLQHSHMGMMPGNMGVGGYPLPSSGTHYPGHAHAQSLSAIHHPSSYHDMPVPVRYGRGRPGTSAGYEGSGFDLHPATYERRWPAAQSQQSPMWHEGFTSSPTDLPPAHEYRNNSYTGEEQDFREGGFHQPPVPVAAPAQGATSTTSSNSQQQPHPAHHTDQALGFRDGNGLGFRPPEAEESKFNPHQPHNNSNGEPAGFGPMNSSSSNNNNNNNISNSKTQELISPSQGFRDAGGTSSSFRGGSFRGDAGAGGSFSRDAPSDRRKRPQERGPGDERDGGGDDPMDGGSAQAPSAAPPGAAQSFLVRDDRQRDDGGQPTHHADRQGSYSPHAQPPPTSSSGRDGGHSFLGSSRPQSQHHRTIASRQHKPHLRRRSSSSDPDLKSASSSSPPSSPASRGPQERSEPSFAQPRRDEQQRYYYDQSASAPQQQRQWSDDRGGYYASRAAYYGSDARYGHAERATPYGGESDTQSPPPSASTYSRETRNYRQLERERDRDDGYGSGSDEHVSTSPRTGRGTSVLLPDAFAFAGRPGTAPAGYGGGGVGSGYGYGYGYTGRVGRHPSAGRVAAVIEREPSSPPGAYDSPFSFHPPGLGSSSTASFTPATSAQSTAQSSQSQPAATSPSLTLAGPGVAGLSLNSGPPPSSRKRTAPDTDFDAHGRPGTGRPGTASNRPGTSAGGTTSRPQSRRLSVMELCNDEDAPPGTAGGGERSSFARAQRLLPVSRPGTSSGEGLVSFFRRPDTGGGRPDTAGASTARPGSSGSPFAFAYPGDRDSRVLPTPVEQSVPVAPAPAPAKSASPRSGDSGSSATPTPNARVLSAASAPSPSPKDANTPTRASASVSPALSAVSANAARHAASPTLSATRPEGIISVSPGGLRV